jgi:hypothetical protein
VEGRKSYNEFTRNYCKHSFPCAVKMKLKKKSRAMELRDDWTQRKEKRRNDEAYIDELRVRTILERNIVQFS